MSTIDASRCDYAEIPKCPDVSNNVKNEMIPCLLNDLLAQVIEGIPEAFDISLNRVVTATDLCSHSPTQIPPFPGHSKPNCPTTPAIT